MDADAADQRFIQYRVAVRILSLHLLITAQLQIFAEVHLYLLEIALAFLRLFVFENAIQQFI
jgi:hypothetical protein